MFCNSETGFVTKIKDNVVYNIIEQKEIESDIHSVVLEDTIIEVTVKEKK